jgi:two-component system alkaline phosphatase synthesis response regulator PhoP
MKSIIYTVEDDPNIQHVIHIALTNSGYDVEGFGDAKSMFAALETKRPNLFLLDIMLPDMDGFAMVQKIKKMPEYAKIPIMIVSAKMTELDKVLGLDYGADDYLTKPFGVLELISRVKALIRRSEGPEIDPVICLRELTLDSVERTCRFQNAKVALTQKEFGLLKILMLNPNKTVSREDIMNSVWGYGFIGESRTLDVHIKEVRQKLNVAGLTGEVIETIRGVGYKFLV